MKKKELIKNARLAIVKHKMMNNNIDYYDLINAMVDHVEKTPGRIKTRYFLKERVFNNIIMLEIFCANVYDTYSFSIFHILNNQIGVPYYMAKIMGFTIVKSTMTYSFIDIDCRKAKKHIIKSLESLNNI